MTLIRLHEGIDVPEYGTHIPWLITEAELFQYAPGAFTYSSCGWPQLRFSLLGVTATFGFNFVTHPEAKLVGVQLDHCHEETADESFRTTSEALLANLGQPTKVDQPDFYHLRWRDDRLSVDNSVSDGLMPDGERRGRVHSLRVFYHAGMPRAWVASGDRTLTEVKRLLNLMPGVEVVFVRGSPSFVSVGLAIRSMPSLARLARITADADVRLSVEIDEYRRLGRDDPEGIVYVLQVPRQPESGPGESASTLQVLGLYVVDFLLEVGLLHRDDADRLIGAFNNLVD
jgi:hypothetical protein